MRIDKRKKAIIAGVAAILLIVSLIFISNIWRERMPPNATVSGVSVGALTTGEANNKILEAHSGYSFSISDSFTQTELVFNDNISLWHRNPYSLLRTFTAIRR